MITATIMWGAGAKFDLDPPFEAAASVWVEIDWPDCDPITLKPINFAAGLVSLSFYTTPAYGEVLQMLTIELPNDLSDPLLAQLERLVGNEIADAVRDSYRLPVEEQAFDIEVDPNAIADECQPHWQAVLSGFESGTVRGLPAPLPPWAKMSSGQPAFTNWPELPDSLEELVKRILGRPLDRPKPD